MRSTLTTYTSNLLARDASSRDWLERGNGLEVYFDDLEPEVWQGNTVVVDGLALEICAVRRTVDGYRAYVTAANAVDELRQACSDDKEGVKST